MKKFLKKIIEKIIRIKSYLPQNGDWIFVTETPISNKTEFAN